MLLPYRCKNPPECTPYVTYGLIALNTLIYLITTRDLLVIKDGVVADWAVSPDTAHQFYRIFTAMFLHEEPFHILGNMLFLWLFGAAVEGRLKAARFSILYVGAGLTGQAAELAYQTLTHSHGFRFGASGAITGLCAAYFVMFPQSAIVAFRFFVWWLPSDESARRRFTVVAAPADLKAWWVVIYYALFNIVNGWIEHYMRIEGSLAFMEDVGGLAGGLLICMALRQAGKQVDGTQPIKRPRLRFGFLADREVIHSQSVDLSQLRPKPGDDPGKPSGPVAPVPNPSVPLAAAEQGKGLKPGKRFRLFNFSSVWGRKEAALSQSVDLALFRSGTENKSGNPSESIRPLPAASLVRPAGEQVKIPEPPKRRRFFNFGWTWEGDQEDRARAPLPAAKSEPESRPKPEKEDSKPLEPIRLPPMPTASKEVDENARTSEPVKRLRFFTWTWEGEQESKTKTTPTKQGRRAVKGDFHKMNLSDLETLLATPTENMDIVVTYCLKAISEGGPAGEAKCQAMLERYKLRLAESGDPFKISSIALRAPLGTDALPAVFFLKLGGRLEGADYQDEAGLCYRRVFDMDRTAQETEIALMRLGRMLEVYYHNPDQAREAYTVLLALFPTGTGAEEAQRALRRLPSVTESATP